jgi:predicted N-acetyltransferase YhbS
LHAPLREQAAEPDCYFIHDVAVAPGFRGKGVAGRLVALALARAAGCHLATVALVAVPGAEGYWERAGFARVPDGEPGAVVVRESYGPQARYMTRTV